MSGSELMLGVNARQPMPSLKHGCDLLGYPVELLTQKLKRMRVYSASSYEAQKGSIQIHPICLEG